MVPKILSSAERRQRQYDKAIATLQSPTAHVDEKVKAAKTVVAQTKSADPVLEQTAHLLPHHAALIEAQAFKLEYKKTKSKGDGPEMKRDAYLETAQAYFTASVHRKATPGLDTEKTIAAAARQLRKGGVAPGDARLATHENLMMAEYHLDRMEAAVMRPLGSIKESDFVRAQQYAYAALLGRSIALPIASTSKYGQLQHIRDVVAAVRNKVEEHPFEGERDHVPRPLELGQQAQSQILRYREELGKRGSRAQANGKLSSELLRSAVPELRTRKEITRAMQDLSRAEVFGKDASLELKAPGFAGRAVQQPLDAQTLSFHLKLPPERLTLLSAVLETLHQETVPVASQQPDRAADAQRGLIPIRTGVPESAARSESGSSSPVGTEPELSEGRGSAHSFQPSHASGSDTRRDRSPQGADGAPGSDPRGSTAKLGASPKTQPLLRRLGNIFGGRKRFVGAEGPLDVRSEERSDALHAGDGGAVASSSPSAHREGMDRRPWETAPLSDAAPQAHATRGGLATIEESMSQSGLLSNPSQDLSGMGVHEGFEIYDAESQAGLESAGLTGTPPHGPRGEAVENSTQRSAASQPPADDKGPRIPLSQLKLSDESLKKFDQFLKRMKP